MRLAGLFFCCCSHSDYPDYLDSPDKPSQLARTLQVLFRLFATLAVAILLISSSGEAREGATSSRQDFVSLGITAGSCAGAINNVDVSATISAIEVGSSGDSPPHDYLFRPCRVAIGAEAIEDLADLPSQATLTGKCLRLPPATGPPTS